jgi:hypothetical protein
MEQSPSNIPPQPPPPFPDSLTGGGPAPSAPRPPKKKWPWILGGCGCLALIAIILAVTVVFWIGKNGKRNTAKFDPYKGSVATLLPGEMSDSGIKFKLSATTDRTASWKRQGATEALGFTYNQILIVIVKIDGVLINFASSADAVTALKATATEEKGTVTSKGKGQRFTAQNGKMVGWTNGSLMCVVVGGTDPAAGNFEKAAPF